MSKSLRQWRTSHLMSIRELAAEAGITPKTLTDLEYGRRRPTYETMRAVCKALGISALDIQEFASAIESRGRCEPGNSSRPPPNGLSIERLPTPVV